MIYVLDTDQMVFLLRGRMISSARTTRQRRLREGSRRIEERCRGAAKLGHTVGLSAITISELEYGARRSDRYEETAAALVRVLAPFVRFEFDAQECAVTYGFVRHALETKGTGIGPLDTLIAAHALALGATMVTNNLREFRRVPNLICENWANPESR